VRLEALGQLTNPVTSSGIEAATFLPVGDVTEENSRVLSDVPGLEVLVHIVCWKYSNFVKATWLADWQSE
jgi:hypothetical protein